jgi:ubiquinone/menaquinone biosynthesis C-methylase UbiE
MKKEVAKKILEKVKVDYSRIAPDFSRTRQALWEEMKDFKKFVKDGDKILDLGCGNGRLYEIFEGMSIDYLGVDNSPELIEFAKQRWGEDENRKFMVGDATNLDWWDGKKYNAVFVIAVLHHIPSDDLRKKVIQNMAQVLEDGGLLIMTNWDLYQTKYLSFVLKNIFLKTFGRSELDFGDALIPWRDPETRQVVAAKYNHAFTLRELERLVKSAGFEVLENFYSSEGKHAHFWTGKNLVTVAEK